MVVPPLILPLSGLTPSISTGERGREGRGRGREGGREGGRKGGRKGGSEGVREGEAGRGRGRERGDSMWAQAFECMCASE